MIRPLTLIFTLMALIASAGADEEKNKIAMLDLEGNGLQEGQLKALANRLRTELFQTQKFTVLERSQMDEIIKEQKLQLSGCSADNCAVEIGQLLGVEYMVIGTIDKVESLYSNRKSPTIPGSAIYRHDINAGPLQGYGTNSILVSVRLHLGGVNMSKRRSCGFGTAGATQ